MVLGKNAAPDQGVNIRALRECMDGVTKKNKGKPGVLRQGVDTFPEQGFWLVFRRLQGTLECGIRETTLIGKAMAVEDVYERFPPTIEVSGHSWRVH